MALTEAQQTTARERIGRVFRFLAEMERRRSTPKRTIAEYPWSLRFSSLPDHPSIQRGRIGTATEDDAEGSTGDDFILKVGRPRETQCPAPPDALREWLLDGWQNIGGEVRTGPPRIIRKSVNEAGEEEIETESFQDSEARVRALAEWIARRNQWEALERPVREAVKVFGKLYDLWGRIERDSEKFEILVGDGVLSWTSPAGAVEHPVLLQKLNLEFDAEAPEFVLRDADASPQLADAMLRSLSEVDPGRVGKALDHLAKGPVHPLGGEDTVGFLKFLVQSLWEKGELVGEGGIPTSQVPQVRRDPVILLGSRDEGYVRALEELLKRLPNLAELPSALVRVVGVMDEPEWADGAEGDALGGGVRDSDIDLLFTKPANAEQERIARRLDAAGCVLVQGPPGTGKTHTIANLIGHLLAQGKSILVTSHTSKALRVLRDSVVPAIRPLCVSVLDSDVESRRQLEAAVAGIAGKLSKADASTLAHQSEELARRRSGLKRDLETAEQKFLRARRAEYEEIVVAGVGTPPSEAARKVAASRTTDNWIPGPVTEGAALPLSVAEIRELYQLNRTVPLEDERDLVGTLPPVDSLPSDLEFAQLVEERSELESVRHSERNVYWLHDQQDPASLDLIARTAEDAVRTLSDPDGWVRECIVAGKLGGPHIQPWHSLVEIIESTHHEIATLQETVLSNDPVPSDGAPTAEQLRICDEIIQHLTSGGGLGYFRMLLKKEWKGFLDGSTVAGRRPNSLAHIEALKACLRQRSLREGLTRRWDLQMVPYGAAPSTTFADRPEHVCFQYVSRIRGCIHWYSKSWSPVESQCAAIGLQLELVLQSIPPNTSPQGELLRIRDAVTGPLLEAVRERSRFLRLQELDRSRGMMLENLPILDVNADPSGVVRAMRDAVTTDDVETYASAWQRAQVLARQRAPLARRQQLLRTLEQSAPAWADAVRNRRQPHDGSEPPGDVLAAWNFRQWSQAIESRASLDFARLQSQISQMKSELHTVTADLVEARTWLGQSRRTSGTQQQSLIGWLDLVRKIGAGTGMRAAKLRALAREKLSECRDAVPVWIMPMARVAESYDPRVQPYDVVIIDEASQSSVLGLLAFAVAKEVVVVGDHEQVSPDAVGQTIDRAEELIATYLNEIPNKDLYDGKTSVYDLARQSFGAVIRLVEHFRCVPEIIQFSNNLCYDGEIKPLREASAVVQRPFTVAHRVADGFATNKVNRREIDEVASLVLAACEMPEYERCTFGVVSLVGDQQALEIDKVLRQQLGPVEHEQRRVLAGNAAQFQGDERDVMFLSMVDSPGLGPLSLRRDDRFRQRFNVAASRAKNQMWVIHSLNPAVDLKPDDLRLRLIRHAENPRDLMQRIEAAEARTESPFEAQVIRSLIAKGYRVTPQWVVGAYRIDMVVSGERGKVAIECDGDRFHPPEALDADMARQGVLERLGWRFIRIRGSEFFVDPARCIEGVFERLSQMDVEPFAFADDATQSEEDDELRLRVVRRAEEIRASWRPPEPDEVDAPDDGELFALN